jgi:hypothetical protein
VGESREYCDCVAVCGCVYAVWSEIGGRWQCGRVSESRTALGGSTRHGVNTQARIGHAKRKMIDLLHAREWRYNSPRQPPSDKSTIPKDNRPSAVSDRNRRAPQNPHRATERGKSKRQRAKKRILACLSVAPPQPRHGRGRERTNGGTEA